jgi:hypothetical protein
MDKNTIFIVISAVFGVALIGFFWTKSEGWGRYTAAVLILLLVLFTSFATFFAGMIDGVYFANLLVAVAGFAGGLLTAREA